ncbi:PREDICTED: odorant-binding protein 2b-like [Chrysochloris asiatica]|uniref:Odorant-binding protein 2b-like n=1 Tax=Chrysochloris asiatica TaxID=185453 RepID=A0A9B0UD26_CHRAS|nr:PREDICTED: odorant-binding protein 2b-like [Chrysochloris asiatica]
MQTLFLTITLSMIATLQAQDPLSFDWEKPDITGTWYLKAIMGPNLGKRYKKTSPLMVTALEDGNLEISFTFLKNNQCQEKRILLKRTEEPGKYSIYEGRKFTFHLQELPMKDHYIFYCESKHNNQTLRLAKLLGRNLDVNVEALEEFKKFTQQKGFPQERLITPTHIAVSRDPSTITLHTCPHHVVKDGQL